jgi:uncharacterized protein
VREPGHTEENRPPQKAAATLVKPNALALATFLLMAATLVGQAATSFAQVATSVGQAAGSPTHKTEALKIAPKWLPWSDDVFAQAKSQQRFVLLDLEAVWCHWCHVMDVTTYRDAKVLALLNKKYLTVRVDQDSRPDLSNRYEDYGWPATVVFDASGHEIVKRQGYLTPDEMASMLQAIIDDPTPGPSVTAENKIRFPANPLVPATLRSALEKDYLAGYDIKQGSWGFDQKFLDWDSVEFAMDLAAKGDARADGMARQTLDAQLQLIDPAWGGVYQYSTSGVWTKPHFEKIMSMQAENLRIYALACGQWHDPKYLQAAQSIQRFLKIFLTSPEGAFYTSQDADLVEGQHSAEYFALDDKARRARGVPRVDKHIYARENGWAIAALASLYGVTADEKTLEQAVRAADWVTADRRMSNGGFRHSGKDVGGPFLGDSVAMTRAYLTLYGVTGDRKWLREAETTMQYLSRTFASAHGAGFVTSLAPTDNSLRADKRAYQPHPQRDENVAVARASNLLVQYTGDEKYRAVSDAAMRYLAAPEIAKHLPVASVLLADYEVTRPPLHLTVVGHKDDPEAKALFVAAMRYPASYKRLEWWDAREGKLPNPDVQYPAVSRAAAYLCTERTCSAPIFKAEEIAGKVRKILGVASQSASLSSSVIPSSAIGRRDWISGADRPQALEARQVTKFLHDSRNFSWRDESHGRNVGDAVQPRQAQVRVQSHTLAKHVADDSLAWDHTVFRQEVSA